MPLTQCTTVEVARPQRHRVSQIDRPFLRERRGVHKAWESLIPKTRRKSTAPTVIKPSITEPSVEQSEVIYIETDSPSSSTETIQPVSDAGGVLDTLQVLHRWTQTADPYVYEPHSANPLGNLVLEARRRKGNLGIEAKPVFKWSELIELPPDNNLRQKVQVSNIVLEKCVFHGHVCVSSHRFYEVNATGFMDFHRRLGHLLARQPSVLKNAVKHLEDDMSVLYDNGYVDILWFYVFWKIYSINVVFNMLHHDIDDVLQFYSDKRLINSDEF